MGAGSGSDGEATAGEMSDGAGARKKKIKLVGSNRGTPTVSRAGSPDPPKGSKFSNGPAGPDLHSPLGQRTHWEQTQTVCKPLVARSLSQSKTSWKAFLTRASPSVSSWLGSEPAMVSPRSRVSSGWSRSCASRARTGSYGGGTIWQGRARLDLPGRAPLRLEVLDGGIENGCRKAGLMVGG
jgi:hypothetical protein